MAITMYQSDRNMVSPANDASLYSAITNGQSLILPRGNKFNITTNGLTVTVGTGQAIIQGRLVEILTPETLTLPANSSGNICIVVDLTKTNDVSGVVGTPTYSVKVNQVYLAAVTGSLTQDDLHNGGFIHEMSIATFTTTTTTANATIKVNTMFDTGWLDLSLAPGTTFSSSVGYAKGRLLNGTIYIQLFNLSTYGSQNQNQIGTLSPLLRPKFVLYFPVTGYDAGSPYLGTVVVRTDGFMYIDFNNQSKGKVDVRGGFNYPLN